MGLSKGQIKHLLSELDQVVASFGFSDTDGFFSELFFEPDDAIYSFGEHTLTFVDRYHTWDGGEGERYWHLVLDIDGTTFRVSSYFDSYGGTDWELGGPVQKVSKVVEVWKDV